jgi:hypothetical protein
MGAIPFYQLHIDIQKEILKTFVVLLCSDSSNKDTGDEDDRNCEVMSKTFVYASLEDIVITSFGLLPRC